MISDLATVIFDPNHAWIVSPGFVDFFAHLGGDFRRIGGPAQRTTCVSGGRCRNGIYQMRYTFLSRDPADEQM